MTKNATYCDKHVSSRKCIFCSVIGCEIGSVIGDDVVGNTIMVHNSGYEVYHWSGFVRFNWFGLYLLSEFIYHDQQVFFLMASPFKGSDHIKPPDREGPSNGDCL